MDDGQSKADGCADQIKVATMERKFRHVGTVIIVVC